MYKNSYKVWTSVVFKNVANNIQTNNGAKYNLLFCGISIIRNAIDNNVNKRTNTAFFLSFIHEYTIIHIANNKDRTKNNRSTVLFPLYEFIQLNPNKIYKIGHTIPNK